MESQQIINNRAETYWFIEPGYTTAQFSVKNFFFLTVTGQFTEVAGTIICHESEIQRSSVSATIKSASLNTRNQRRALLLKRLR